MAQDAAFSSLPPYTVRRSARARYARLVISSHEGLVVVVPSRFDTSKVPELVAARADWIERSSRRLGGLPQPPGPPCLPDEVTLGALAERWRLVRREASGRSARVEEHTGRLVVHWDGGPEELAVEALRGWLSRRARAALVPWLARLAEAEGLSIGRVAIRAQRTRWASCSGRGDISLNRALLFLPPELVGHVIHHELSHRYELNHSARFRARLLAMDPDTPLHEASLRTAWRLVPRWAG